MPSPWPSGKQTTRTNEPTKPSRGASPPSRERVARYRRGVVSEWLAALLLMAKGYRILARRYKTPVGEIDIIARRRYRLAFVEVKRRKTLDDAILSVTPLAEQRIRRTAEYWLARHPAHENLDLGLDVILIAPRRLPRHVKDALPHDQAYRSQGR